MVAAAAAVSSAILGTVAVVPGQGGGNEAESVYMASTRSATDVLHGIASGEPLPYVPLEPYDVEVPRAVPGPDLFELLNLNATAEDLPAPLITTPGSRAIPPRVLAAYQAAARIMRKERPGCHISWPILAGIGRIESGHARGGAVDAKGTTLRPIVGPALTGEGNFALIRDSDGGKLDGDTVYDRAVGPMQFLPGTWAGLGRDGNGDGKADPNNVADAALAAATYLCLGGGDLRDREDLLAAVFRYNRSWEYVSHVLAWAGVYAKSGADAKPGTGAKPGKGGKPGKGHGSTTGPTTGPTPTPTPAAPRPTPTPTPPADPTPEPTPEPSPEPTDPATDPATDPTPEPTPVPTTAAVGGRVFLDADGWTETDTVDDVDDTGVAAATVRIFGTSAAGDAVDLTVETDVEGRFLLTDLAPGTYSVRLVALPGGLRSLGVLAATGWLLGGDGLEGVEVAAGNSVAVGFFTEPGA